MLKIIKWFSIVSLLLIPAVSYASNISNNNAYAWGNVIGWINFNATNSNVNVTDTQVTGYAWSSNYGWINLNPTNGGVVNDGNGNLSGKAWGQNTGWIDFTGVSINTSGTFVGQTASSPKAGIINFSCTSCNVNTTWRKAVAVTQTSNTNTSLSSLSGSSGGTSRYIPNTTQTQPAVTLTQQIISTGSDLAHSIKTLTSNVRTPSAPSQALALPVTPLNSQQSNTQQIKNNQPSSPVATSITTTTTPSTSHSVLKISAIVVSILVIIGVIIKVLSLIL